MTTYPNMGLSLPTRGAPGSGVWGDTDDANWAKVDAHDHTTGKGLPITTAAISINADLPFGALWAPTQLHRVQFSNIAGGALAAGQRKSLFVSDGTSGLVANELYWLNSSGNKVQLTAGNTLNFAAFVGGIGGDYTSVGAQLNFADSQKAYEFKEGTADTNGWARLRSGDLRLFPFNTTAISAYVGQAAPVGIVSPYTVTWPLALPGSTTLQQIDNTGQAIFSNTVPNAVTFSAALTVAAGGAAITGNSTVTGNLNVTGTLTNGETRTYSVAFGVAGSGATFTVGGSPPSIAVGTATAAAAILPLTFKVGVTITAWEVRLIKNTDNTKTLSAKLWKGITPTQVGATQSSSANAPGLITLGQSGLADVVATQTAYFIEIVGSGTSGDIVEHYYQATTS